MKTMQKKVKVIILGSFAFVVILAAAVWPEVKISVGATLAILMAVWYLSSVAENKKMTAKSGKEKFFSQSKWGSNLAIVVVVGMVLTWLIVSATIVPLVIALLLSFAEVYLGPLELTVFNVDLTPIISWSVSHQWLLGGLSIAVLVYFWLIFFRGNLRNRSDEKLRMEIDKEAQKLERGASLGRKP